MLSDNAYTYILDKLMKGELIAGDMLNRRDMALEIGISVAPVSEAMIRLENEGFLKSLPRKGTIVQGISNDDIHGMLLMKEAIECTGALLYTGDDVREKRDYFMEQALLLDSGKLSNDNIAFWKADLALHRSLLALAGNQTLLREYERIAVPNLYYYLNKLRTTAIHRSFSHVELINEMMDNNREKAAKYLRIHLRSDKGFKEVAGRL